MTLPASSPGQDRNIYTVSRLNEMVKGLLEHNLPPLWVEGEISNFSAPRSGHWYFTLKDAQAQVRCAMWRTRAATVGFLPKDGEQVLVRASVGLYEPRGDYQLVVERIQPAGLGALQRAFEQLKEKLQKEGLFDPSRKRELPRLPRCIGVITSPTGAAIRDVLTTLGRRYPMGEVVLYPVPVQGKEAAPAIISALATAARRGECDVLILTRGGGSLEDLWAFNEESVARAIAACPIPVVGAVGHETDFTIADFVADLRAATPTGAAEQVTPDSAEWQRTLDQDRARMSRALANLTTALAARLASGNDRLRLQHPARRLEQFAQRLDDLDIRIGQASRLMLAAKRHRLELGARSLDTLSPLRTLERGYAIATRKGHPLRRAQDAAAGDSVQLRLHEGMLDCTVKKIHEGSN